MLSRENLLENQIKILCAINAMVIEDQPFRHVLSETADLIKELFDLNSVTIFIRQDNFLVISGLSMDKKKIKKFEAKIGARLIGLKIPIKKDGVFYKILEKGEGDIFYDRKKSLSYLSRIFSLDTKDFEDLAKIFNDEIIIRVPMKIGEKPLGILSIGRQDNFDDNDVHALQILSNQLAIAIRLLLDECELKKNAAMYEALVENATDAIIGLDEFGRVIVWNKSANELLGWEKAEIYGQEFHCQIFNKEKGDKICKQYLDFANTGKSDMLDRLIESEVTCKDGQKKTVEFTLAAYPYGKNWRCTAIVRDIKDRIVAEKNRRELEIYKAREKHFNIYTSALELASVPIILWSEERIVFSNEKACRLLGVDRYGLSQRKFSEFVFENDKDKYNKHLNQLRKTEPGRSLFVSLRLVGKGDLIKNVDLQDSKTSVGNGHDIFFSMVSDKSYISAKLHEHNQRLLNLAQKVEFSNGTGQNQKKTIT